MARPDGSPRVMMVLTAGVLATSTAAVLIRLAHAPPASVTAWRLAGGGAFYLALLGLRRGRPDDRPLSRHQRLMVVASGAALFLHFFTWILSLEYTSVVSSVVLVTTAPVWVAVGSTLFLGERPGGLTWVGVLVALAGAVTIALADRGQGGGGPAPLWGDFLAMAGAWCLAVYYLAGRRLRRDLDTVRYVALVYGTAALFALAVAGGGRQPLFRFGGDTWVYLGLIVLLPQIIGHTTYNWALGYVSATFASVAGLMEPVGAGLLAWLVLTEVPGAVQAAGAVTVLLGVWLAARGEAVSRPGVDRAGRG